MSDAAVILNADDAILESAFIGEMVRQMRALDSYGSYDDWPTEKLLSAFVLTREQKREIPVIGDPDEVTMARIRAFYNAISVQIEQECKLFAIPLINLTHEGFGRAIITVGKLVVMDKTLRDVHRFGFPSLSKMKDEADKLLSVALEIIGKYPQVAGL